MRLKQATHFTILCFAFLMLPFAQASHAAVDSVKVNGYVIDDDINGLGGSNGNNNGLVDYGETIELILEMRNYGNTNATGVVVDISTSDPDITITDASVPVGSISANGTANAIDFDFVVDSNITQRDIVFLVSVSSDQGTWTENLLIPVTGKPADVSYAAQAIDDDNLGSSSGNSDGNINGNETIELSLDFTNNGGQAARDCIVRLNSTSSLISFSDSIKLIGDIAAGGTVSVSNFVFNVGQNSLATQDTIEFLISADNGSWTGAFAISIEGGPAKLIWISSIIDDDTFGSSNGNGDGIIQGNETIEIHIVYANIGGQSATGINAIPRTTDPDVTLTDSTATLTSIASQDTLTASTDFDFQVANIATSKQAQFELVFNTNQGQFRDTFELTLAGFANITFFTRAIDDDAVAPSNGNGNSQINAGERVELDLSLNNSGGDNATNAWVVVSTSDADVSFVTDSIFVPQLNAGAISLVEGFVLDVNQGIENKTVPIDVAVTADQGSWSFTFNQNMFGVTKMAYAAHAIDDDNFGSSSGNSNAKVDAGEVIELVLDIQNVGGNGATNIDAIIRCSSPFITITDSTKFVGSVSGSSQTTITSDYDFQVDPSTPNGEIKFELIINCDQGSFVDSFFVNVTGIPSLSIVDASVDDGALGLSSGNADNDADANERVELGLSMVNEGGDTASSAYAILSSSAADIRIVSDSIFFGSIAPGDTVNLNTYLVDFGPAVLSQLADFDLTIHSAEGVFTSSFTLPVTGLPNLIVDTVFVDDDSNGGSTGDGDGIIEAGESIEILLQLENLGGASANNATVVISTSDTLISISDSSKFVSKINSGSLYSISSDYDFTVHPFAPNKIVSFTVTISSDEGVFTDVFNLEVQGTPNLEFVNYFLDDDNSGLSSGNNSSSLDAGEQVELDLSFINSGNKLAENLSVKISNTDAGVTLLNDSSFVGNVGVGVTALAFDFLVKVDSSFVGDELVLDFIAQADNGSWTDQVIIPVQGFIDLQLNGYQLSDDPFSGSNGDSDGIAEAGETIEILLGLKNLGGATANNIEVHLASLDSRVVVTDSIKNVPSIKGQQTYSISSDFDFIIGEDVGTGTMPFVVTMTADEGVWTRSLNIPVQGRPRLSLDSAQIQDFGMVNGEADAGDSVLLSLYVSNIGTLQADSVYALVSTDDTSLQMVVDSVYLGSIALAGQNQINGFSFLVANNVIDHTADFDIQLVSNNGSWLADYDLSVHGTPSLAYSSHVIDDDQFGSSNGNADGVVNSGESVELLLNVANVGGGSASNVLVTLRSRDADLQFTDSVKYVSTIRDNRIFPITSDYDFDVAITAPSKTVWVDVTLESDEGTFLDSFALQVIGTPVFETVALLVNDDNVPPSMGNNDSVAGFGETVELQLSLSNIGLTNATNVYAKIISADTSLNFLADSINFGNILSFDTVTAGFSILEIAADIIEFDRNLSIAIFSDQADALSSIAMPVRGAVNMAYVSHLIDDDLFDSSFGDGDSVADAGESIELYVAIGNTKGGVANNLVATIGTNDPDITLTDSVKSFVAFDSFDTAFFSSDFDFDIAAQTATKTVKFWIDMDSDDGFFTDTFFIPVNARPVFSLDTTYVDDDTVGISSGDADGLIEAGEDVGLSFFFSNIGLVDADNIQMTFASSAADIIVVKDSTNFVDTLKTGQSALFSGVLISVSPTATYQIAVCTLNISTGQGIFQELVELEINGPLSLRAEEIVLSDDAFSGSNGNNDSVLQGGERIEMQVRIANSGPGKATGIRAELRTNHPKVALLDSVFTTRDLDPGESYMSGSDFDFELADDISTGTVEFYVDLISDQFVGTDTVVLQVFEGEAELSLAGYILDVDRFGDSYGDGDTLLEAGETAELVVTINNAGTRRAENVQLSLHSFNPDITLIRQSITTSSVDGLDDKTPGTDFIFKVAKNMNTQQISFRLNVSSALASFDTIISFMVHRAREIKVEVLPDTADCEVTGAGFYDPLDFVTLRAKACDGLVFKEWIENGMVVGTADSLTVQTGSGGTLQAVYRQIGVGIEEQDFAFEVFPNPFSDQIVISLENGISSTLTYRLYNQLGAVVLSGNQNKVAERLELETPNSLSPGLYILELEIAGTLQRFKLMKQD